MQLYCVYYSWHEKNTELKNHDVIETGKIKNKTSRWLVKKQKYANTFIHKIHLHNRRET